VTAAERSRARDLLRSRPGDAAVMGYRVIDRRADVRALRTLREVRPRDDRVAVAPRGDVLLVERRFRRAEERARALRDARRNRPGPPLVGRMRDEDVGVDLGRRLSLWEAEPERRVVRAAVGVEGEARITGRVVLPEANRVLAPRLAAVEADVRARVHRLLDGAAVRRDQLVVVGAADDVARVRRVDGD